MLIVGGENSPVLSNQFPRQNFPITGYNLCNNKREIYLSLSPKSRKSKEGANFSYQDSFGQKSILLFTIIQKFCAEAIKKHAYQAY